MKSAKKNHRAGSGSQRVRFGQQLFCSCILPIGKKMEQLRATQGAEQARFVADGTSVANILLHKIGGIV